MKPTTLDVLQAIWDRRRNYDPTHGIYATYIYDEVRKKFPDVSSSMLSTRLAKLETLGLITRSQYALGNYGRSIKFTEAGRRKHENAQD